MRLFCGSNDILLKFAKLSILLLDSIGVFEYCPKRYVDSVFVSLCEIISRPLIGGKLATSQDVVRRS